METVKGFQPVVNNNSRVLILGTLPGKESLRKKQYYAYSGNLFWRIMSHLIKLDLQWPYQRKVQHLLDNHIAIWDVLRDSTDSTDRGRR